MIACACLVARMLLESCCVHAKLYAQMMWQLCSLEYPSRFMCAQAPTRSWR